MLIYHKYTKFLSSFVYNRFHRAQKPYKCEWYFPKEYNYILILTTIIV